MLRLLTVISLLVGCDACWLYDKGYTVDKIQKNLAVLGRSDVNRKFFADEIDKMPRIFGWAVNQIGVEPAFKDYDANKDGLITLNEMRQTSTCLDSCFKLSIVNLAL